MVLYKLTVDESRRMNCGACQDLCPATCVEFTKPDNVSIYGDLFGSPLDGVPEAAPKLWMMEKPYLAIQERCTGCQVCVRECPTNAIMVDPDLSKPMDARPKPVVLKPQAKNDEDGYWHPLSEFTKDFLKRPVRSPWSTVSDWKPTLKPRAPFQTWRTMRERGDEDKI